MRGGRAVVEDGGPEPGAECDDQLEALARDHGEPLHVGVVGQAHRLAQPGLQLGRQREPGPGLAQLARHRGTGSALGREVGRGQHPPGPDDAREADRDPVPGRQVEGQLVERPDEDPGRARVRRALPHAVHDLVAVGVEHRRLQTRPADVDRKRRRGHGRGVYRRGTEARSATFVIRVACEVALYG
jgi:hypothetical protein